MSAAIEIKQRPFRFKMWSLIIIIKIDYGDISSSAPTANNEPLFYNSEARSRVDRFIPAREYCVEQRRRHRPAAQEEEDTPDSWHVKHIQQQQYASHLDVAFGLDSPRSSERDLVQPWPCAPRKKTFLTSADSVLDLPSYSDAPFPELLDWSSNDVLVAALGNIYHRWSWRTQSLINKGYTRREVFCCKFSPKADMLILGTFLSTVEIHDNERNKLMMNAYCVCWKQDQQYCSITALDWSPTGNSFVAGCARGKLVSFSRSGQRISWCDAFDTAITVVRVSPDARYVAVTAADAGAVLILLWPALKRYGDVRGEKCVMKTMCWHPWRSAFLAIGSDAQQQVSIALHDVPSSKLTVDTVTDDSHVVDAMLFSDRTGELVMSLWDKGEESGSAQAQVVVLRAPGAVVDRRADRGLDRVRTMVFSPDGTKLATATNDEDLIIWNFLPDDRRNKPKNRRFSAIPVYLDNVSFGLSLR